MNRKIKLSFVLILFSMILSLTGCVSNERAKRLIASGDKVTAIEILSKRISSKRDDEEAIELFVSVYPSAVEELYTKETVKQIRKEFASKYSASETEAIRKCRNQLANGKTITSHPDVASVISRSSKLINNLSGLVRIKNAVSVLPARIGNSKTGEYEVVKYTEDFASMYATAKYELGEFYYNLAEALYPGQNVEERASIINLYKNANSYAGSIGNCDERCAELCYLNGYDYEMLNSIQGHKTAIEWYKNSLTWVNNYRDASRKVQILSYEIAMALLDGAQTKDDYKEIITYLENAGDYKDAKTYILKVKYYLAYLYLDDHTAKSYETAGKLFVELGNYKNSPYEASLYNFYKKLKSLGKTYSENGISLSSGNYVPFTMSRNLTPGDNGKGSLSVSCRTSNIDVYIPSMEKTIYPGSIITGESIANQKFNQFAYGTRNVINYSVSSAGRNLGDGVVTYAHDGAYSVNEIRKHATRYGSQMEVDCTYEFHTVYSPEDLALTTGIGAGRDKVSYAIGSYNWNPEKSYTLVKVTQKFYSTSMYPPKLPVDFFVADKNVVTEATLKSVTPYYVSSVDYGRKAYFVICSDLPSEEIIRDITACRPRDRKNSGATGMRVNPEVSYKWSHNGTTVSAITVSEKIYSINDLDGIYNWLKIGTSMAVEVSDIVPISFSLRNLADNSYAQLSQSHKVSIRLPTQKEVKETQETKVENSGIANIPPATEKPHEVQHEEVAKPVDTGNTQKPSATETKPVETKPAETKPAETKPAETKPAETKPSSGSGGNKPASAYETASTINGTKVPASAYNGSTSLIFVGKKGYYTCSSVTTERGSGVKTWYYDIPSDEIEVCVASWSDSEYKTVQVNGINMNKNKTVYSFRDVHGNTISLDTVDSNGIRVHHLLVVRKK